MESRYTGISIGSYPWFKPGQFGTAVVVSGLDNKITSTAADEVEAAVRLLGAEAHTVGIDGKTDC